MVTKNEKKTYVEYLREEVYELLPDTYNYTSLAEWMEDTGINEHGLWEMLGKANDKLSILEARLVIKKG